MDKDVGRVPTAPGSQGSAPQSATPSSPTGADPSRRWLARFESFLGNSYVSWICMCIVASHYIDSFWIYVAVGIPLANYTVKIDQIHRMLVAQGTSAGTAETLAAQGDSPQGRSEGCAQGDQP